MRAEQEAKKVNFGYYGEYAVWRDRPIEDVEAAIAASKPWVLRFRSMNEALRIMTGEKLVATSFDINADLYGWKWTRIRDGRTNNGGRNRKS